MYQLIRLDDCIHVFDDDNCAFVKSTFANIKKAIDFKHTYTRKIVLESIEWVRCTDPKCRFQNCRFGKNEHEGHWLAKRVIQYY